MATGNDRFTSPLFVGDALRRAAHDAQAARLDPHPGHRSTAGASSRACPRPFIVVANHSSHLDAPLIIGGMPWGSPATSPPVPRPTTSSTCGGASGSPPCSSTRFPIDRSGEGKRGGLSQVRCSSASVPLLIFPEGGRSQDGELGTLQAGRRRARDLARGAVRSGRASSARTSRCRGAQNWPSNGRLPVAVVFGAPMRPHSDETRRRVLRATCPTKLRRCTLQCRPIPRRTAQKGSK